MPFLFILFGAYSLISQVLVLREISFLFTGHELSLALSLSGWLFWTGLGSSRKTPENPSLVFYLLCVVSAIMPFSLILARSAAMLIAPGIVPGLFAITAISLLFTLPAGLLNGLFIAGAMKESRQAASFYILEALGACAGGLAYAFFMAGKINPVLILSSGTAGLVIYALTVPGIRPGLFRSMASVFLVLAAAAGAAFLDSASLRAPYKGAEALSLAETPYVRLGVARQGAAAIVFENGLISGQYPEPSANEALPHLALLAHRKPKNVLITGAEGLLFLPQVLKHKPKTVDIADPDAAKFKTLGAWLGISTAACSYFPEDARHFLQRSPRKYDVMIQPLQEPVNAAANRFFTLEFFGEASAALDSGGILIFAMPSSENYLSPEETYFNSCILKTAKEVFRHVAMVPGSRMTVLASHNPVELFPDRLAERYRSRRIRNEAMMPSAFPFMLSLQRRQWLESSLLKIKRVPLNSDFYPVSYFYLWRVWLAKFVSPAFLMGIFAAAGLSVFGLAVAWRKIRSWSAGSSALLALGFWSMAVEVILILAFQSSTGALYWQMGILFSAFMLGLSAGARALRASGLRSAVILRVIAGVSAAFSLALAVLLQRLAGLPAVYALPVYSFLLFAAGILTGAAFASALSLEKGGGGRLYAADVWGACAGGLLTGSVLIPLLGFKTALVLTVFPCILPFLVLSKKKQACRKYV
ncbi:MAG: hypothetical protein ABIG11_03880 [bacterium]